jgi:glycine cleavage system H protein
MSSPDDRRYTESHEWHKPEDGLITIGLTRFAVDELTDITFVDITHTDGPIKAGEVFGEIESVKATSEMYSGIDGTVVEVNQEVIDNPAVINQDPFEKGWLVKIKPDSPAQLDAMMTAAQYDQGHGG